MTGQTAAGVKQFAARVKRTTDQTITTATNTAVSFDTTVVFDYGGFFSSGSPTKLTCPRSGLYVVTVNGAPWVSNATGIRFLYLRKNGTAYTVVSALSAQNPALGYWQQPGCAMVFDCAAGDYFETIVYQDSGGNLALSGSNSNPEMSIALLA